jgi:hypothetical protein
MASVSIFKKNFKPPFSTASILAGNSSWNTGGYFPGGPDGIEAPHGGALIQKISLPTETVSQISATLSSSRREGAAFVNRKVAGYTAGGQINGISGAVATVDKISLPTEIRSTLGTGLSATRQYGMGLEDGGTTGFHAGGYSGASSSGVVNKFAFATDVRSSSPALDVATRDAASFSNAGVAGYVAGGLGAGGTIIGQVNKLIFPTDTRTTVTSLPANSRSNYGMYSTGVAGYVAGGITSSNPLQTVTKYSFPSDTQSSLGTRLSIASQRSMCASIDGLAGYTAGGRDRSNDDDHTASQKFNFANETASLIVTFFYKKKSEGQGFGN